MAGSELGFRQLISRLALLIALAPLLLARQAAGAAVAEANGTTIIFQINVPGGANPTVSLLTYTEDNVGAT